VGTLDVPVTFNVTPALPELPQAGPPLVASIANAASQITGVVSPGEILTIFGLNIGPPNPAGVSIGPDGKIATNLGGTRVLFDGVAAPLLYVSPTQTNVIVPYEVADRTATKIEVEYNGTTSEAWGVRVAPAAPSIFTLDSSGQGRAAVLNQDNWVNNPSNPAARGSVIQIYATGEGMTSPPGTTGSITHTDIKKPVQRVAVTMGGIEAPLQYAGSAPESVTGLFQMNAVVPQGVAPGPSVPIEFTVGTARSQPGVTIAVK
jgi:uncharacterized protein (TIGR03437 family)